MLRCDNFLQIDLGAAKHFTGNCCNVDAFQTTSNVSSMLLSQKCFLLLDLLFLSYGKSDINLI